MAFQPGRWQERTPAQALAGGEPCYFCAQESDFAVLWGNGRFIVVCVAHLRMGRLFIACQLAAARGVDLDDQLRALGFGDALLATAS